MRHLDLFSGIGGFALAVEEVWGRNVEHIFCDIEPFSQRILAKHWPKSLIHGDIRTLKGTELGDIDILTGGFPCQPFSTAGNQRGTDDNRWLWPEMLRVITETRPTWVVAENVAGIINMALEQVCTDLEAIGYEVQPLVIPAASVNAPHKRERVWIIATDTEHNGQSTSQVSSGVGTGNDRNKEGKEPGKQPQRLRGTQHAGWDTWPPRPYVRGMDDGLPFRVDRIKSLGNAIVPQVAAEIMRAMNQPTKDV